MKKSRSVILIDDDRFTHWGWRFHCKRLGLQFVSFFTIEEFLEASSSFPSDCIIFLDSYLGDGVRGEVEGVKISARGFSEIYLSTSLPQHEIDRPTWLKGIYCKNPGQVDFLN